MPGIKAPLIDILERLRTLTITNGDGESVAPHVRVWNNQLAELKDGSGLSFPLPAFFPGIYGPVVYEDLGQGARTANIVWRVHILHEFMDAEDGTYEQNLEVFDLRDRVVSLLTGFSPTGCASLYLNAEETDEDHDNVYHYILDFSSTFTDGGDDDDDGNGNKKYIYRDPPTDLEIHTTLKGSTNDAKISFFTINP